MASQFSGSLNLTGSLQTTGSILLIGNETITGSLFVSNQIATAGITASILSTNGGVSSSQQISNYFRFAETASANTFYGNQSVTGSLNISGSINFSGSLNISGSITNTKYIDFSLEESPAAVGRLGWDAGEGTLTIGLSGGNVNIPIGVTSFETAFNADSSSISKGDVVRVNGAQGNRVAVQKANNLNDDGSATTVALAAETIGVGAEGKVILSGPLKGINTTAFAEGDLLYLSSTPGGITNIKPQAPLHEVRIGVAQRIHASVGIVNVKVDNGYELDELHNVRITTASLAHNQLLAYSGSVWRNETIGGLGIAITGSNVFSGNQTITGSLNVSSGITGSLFGSASWAINSTKPISSLGTNNIYSTQPAAAIPGFANSNNIILGLNAGSGSTYLGTSNLLGPSAGRDMGVLTVAVNNNFFGNQAGRYAEAVSNSNFFGSFSGYDADNAEQSNFFGRNSGHSAYNASYSTLIGLNAGRNSELTNGIGRNNIIIGTNITLENGRTDSINLGGLIFGTGSYFNDNESSYPFSDSANGRIGINQPLPQFSLDVSGSGRYTNGLNVTGSFNVSGSLTINSGSITMPNRPAFRVVGTASTDRTGVYTLSGSNFTIDYNEGNHFNNTNGKFTAPIAGLYNVYYNGRVGSVDSQMQVIIYKNGAAGTAQLMWEAPGLAASSHFGVSGIVKLAAGDTLEAKVTVGSIQFDGNDSFGATYIG